MIRPELFIVTNEGWPESATVARSVTWEEHTVAQLSPLESSPSVRVICQLALVPMTKSSEGTIGYFQFLDLQIASVIAKVTVIAVCLFGIWSWLFLHFTLKV